MNKLLDKIYHCYYQINYGFTKEEKSCFRNHLHEYYEALILVEGSIDVITQSKIYHLNTGDFIVIQPNLYHVIESPNINYKRIILHFSVNQNCESYKDIIETLNSTNYVKAENFSRINEYVSRFLHYYQSFSKQEFDLLSDGLINEFILLLHQNAPNIKNESHTELSPLLQEIIKYIDDNISERITLNDIAAHFNMNANYISILFKRKMHIPIITYVKNKQLLKAHILIKSGVPSTQVYYKVGFSNYSNFFRMYKRAFEEAPSHRKHDKQ